MSLSRSRKVAGLSALLALTLSTFTPDLSAQTWSAGAVFPLFSVEDFCESSTFGGALFAFETPVAGSVQLQVEGFFSPSGSYAWPWHTFAVAGGSDNAPGQVAYDHEGGLQLAVNLLIPLTQPKDFSRFNLKALVGLGARRLGSADYSAASQGQPEQLGVDTQTSPLVMAGLVADIGLTDRVGLRLQGRGNAIFAGELQLKGASAAQDIRLDSDTQVFAQATAGLTISVGR